MDVVVMINFLIDCFLLYRYCWLAVFRLNSNLVNSLLF